MRARRQEEGTILILVLIIVTFITVLVADTMTVATVEHEASMNANNDLILDFAMKGGLEIAKAYLVNDKDTSAETDHLGEEWADPKGITRVLDPQSDGLDPGGFDHSGSEQKAPEIRIVIEDEERKWPLPILTLGNEQTKRRRIEGLANVITNFRKHTRFRVEGSDARDLAERIANFVTRKENEAVGPTPRPLSKSGCLLSTTDLALLPELDPFILFDQVDHESSDGNSVVPGLLNFVTLWSDLVINVNTAPESVLMGLFRSQDASVGHDVFITREEKIQKLEGEQGQETTRQRERRQEREAEARRSGTGATGENPEEEAGGAPFNTVDEVKEAVPTLVSRIFNEVRTMLTVKSTVYSVWVEAKFLGVKKMRRWVLRQQGARFIMILSEQVDYSRLLPLTDEEQDAVFRR